LREKGYSLKVLARVLEQKGVVITTDALSTYMTKLPLPREEGQLKAARKRSSVASTTVEGSREEFQMKADVPL